MIQAESQAVMNTLTQHEFQDAFKNGRSTENSAYAHMEGDYFKGDGGQ
jgi:hypothetical protein